MTFDISYQRRGEKTFNHHLKTVETEAQARKLCKNLANFPPDTIHYVIDCDDGRTIHDTRKDGLL